MELNHICAHYLDSVFTIDDDWTMFPPLDGSDTSKGPDNINA